MAETFTAREVATAYCGTRSKDYKDFCNILKIKTSEGKVTIEDGSRHQCVDLGYCRIHVIVHKWPDGSKTNECWVANRRGETMVAGRNVANSQVADFILRKFW